MKIYLCFLLRVFWFGLIFRPLVHFDLCVVWGRESNFIYLFIYFECGCPTVPAPSIKEMFLFAIEWTWNSSLTLFLWKYYACLSDIPLFGVFWALFLLSFALSYSNSCLPGYLDCIKVLHLVQFTFICRNNLSPSVLWSFPERTCICYIVCHQSRTIITQVYCFQFHGLRRWLEVRL